jgi:hypothetical protein
MSEKENDAALYSLKELKDMPNDSTQQDALSRQQSEVANVKPVKSKKGGWASDEGLGDLLAGILDDTNAAAIAEENEIRAELQAHKQEEEARKHAEEARKRSERDERIAEEQARRQNAERVRASLVRAIEGPSEEELEAKRRAEEEGRKRVEMEARLQEAERARQEAERKAKETAREAKRREELRLAALAKEPAPAKKSGMGFLVAAVLFGLVALVVVGGGIGGFLYIQKSQKIEAKTFVKTTLKPSPVTSASTDGGFMAMNVATGEETSTEAAGAVATKARRGGGNTTKTRKAVGRVPKKTNNKSTKKNKPKFNFDGGGKGGLVF